MENKLWKRRLCRYFRIILERRLRVCFVLFAKKS